MELQESVRAYISVDNEEEKNKVISLLDKHGYVAEEDGNDFICVDISGCNGEWDTIKEILDYGDDYVDEDDAMWHDGPAFGEDLDDNEDIYGRHYDDCGYLEHDDGTMIDEEDGERLREHDDWERY